MQPGVHDVWMTCGVDQKPFFAWDDHQETTKNDALAPRNGEKATHGQAY